jgi:cation diffusion facilitator CzcD-associated flavoprotein CzcO
MESKRDHVRILIVGTGFAGLGAAIRLRQEGITDFAVLERAEELGGTWRENTYPGCACDVPSHLYSFSFAPNPSWSSTFSPQAEIQAYLLRTAEEAGVRPHVRFSTEMLDAAWDDDAERWRVSTSKGDLTCDHLVLGMGALSEPADPDIPGLDSFRGTTFHSAAWDHDHDLTGERVAVIGTGASAIQFVPEVRKVAAQVHVFQRTAPWVLPRTDRPVTGLEQRLYRLLPPTQRLMRAAIYWARELNVLAFTSQPGLMRLAEAAGKANIAKAIRDPELRRQVTPTYAPGCKRILLSNTWYPALAKPNVELVTDRIAEVRPSSIVTADGSERTVDTIIFGTGFHVTDNPGWQRVKGRDGRVLADTVAADLNHLGSECVGFPNLFLMTGLNTGLGHSSMVFMVESQLNLLVSQLRHLERTGYRTVEPRPEAQAAWNEEIQRRMEGTVWTSGCSSWYLDAAGRNATLWPGYTWEYRLRTRRFDPAEHLFDHVATDPDPEPGLLPA